MEHIYRADCRKSSEEDIKKTISLFLEAGWVYEGILENAPPPHRWLSFIWKSESEPIYPQGYPEPKKSL